MKQIETHYGDVVSKQRRQQITHTNRKNKSSSVRDGTAMTDDDFVAEAMRRHQAGELSDEALAIAKLKS